MQILQRNSGQDRRQKKDFTPGPVVIGGLDAPKEGRLTFVCGRQRKILNFGAALGELLRPRRASKLLRLCSGVRRSGLSLRIAHLRSMCLIYRLENFALQCGFLQQGFLLCFALLFFAAPGEVCAAGLPTPPAQRIPPLSPRESEADSRAPDLPAWCE